MSSARGPVGDGGGGPRRRVVPPVRCGQAGGPPGRWSVGARPRRRGAAAVADELVVVVAPGAAQARRPARHGHGSSTTRSPTPDRSWGWPPASTPSPARSCSWSVATCPPWRRRSSGCSSPPSRRIRRWMPLAWRSMGQRGHRCCRVSCAARRRSGPAAEAIAGGDRRLRGGLETAGYGDSAGRGVAGPRPGGPDPDRCRSPGGPRRARRAGMTERRAPRRRPLDQR